MGLFGKSFEEKVAEALDTLRSRGLGIEMLSATIDGKVVTLTGVAKSAEAKSRVMTDFNAMVETENTLNQIRVDAPKVTPAPPATVGRGGEVVTTPVHAPMTSRTHVVVKGDTLSAIAKTYYGKSSVYMKIFEANKDILKDPDKIQVGQKLEIPE